MQTVKCLNKTINVLNLYNDRLPGASYIVRHVSKRGSDKSEADLTTLVAAYLPFKRDALTYLCTSSKFPHSNSGIIAWITKPSLIQYYSYPSTLGPRVAQMSELFGYRDHQMSWGKYLIIKIIVLQIPYTVSLYFYNCMGSLDIACDH